MVVKRTEKKDKAQVQVQALTVQARVHLQIPLHNQKMKEEKDAKIKEATVKTTEGTFEEKAAKEKIKDRDQRTERWQKKKKEKNQDMDHPDMMTGTGRETEEIKRGMNVVEAETINVLADDHDCITLN